MLWLLALIVPLVVGRTVLGFDESLIFERVYTIPLTKPTKIAETLGIVTGALKKIKPETAMGNLFRAPTMEYVVDDVTRTHQAEL